MRLFLALMAVWLVLAAPVKGMAEEVAQPAAQDELQSLLRVLEDDQARAKLISQIKSVQAMPVTPAGAPIPLPSTHLPRLFQQLADHLSQMSAADYAQAVGLSLGFLLAAWSLSGLSSKLLKHAVRWLARHEERMPGLAHRAARYLPFLKGTFQLLLGIAVVLGVLAAFDVEVVVWLESPQGRWLITRGLTIYLVMAAAVFLWEVAGASLEGMLKRIEGEGRRHGRLKTLIPIIQRLLAVLLLAMAGLIALSELGVNIAPLLAGAGMVGLAFGLGAQKMVQDMLGSITMLLEDTLAVGDVVKIGEHAGVIEKMTLMDIQLRDQAGYLHVIPFSKVDSFVNMTVDFAYAVFEIGVAYRENVDDVMMVLIDLGGEIQEDEQFGQMIMEPLEMLGLDKFADSAVILKCRIKTEAGKQWQVMREFNRRIKSRFDELGIEIPFPQTTLWFGIDKQGAAPPGRIAVQGK